MTFASQIRSPRGKRFSKVTALTGRFLVSNEAGLILIILVIGAGFTVAAPNFMGDFNFFVLSRTAALNIMIGLSMMAVIVTGGLNLAIGAIGVCAAMTFGWCVQEIEMGLPAAASFGLLLAIILGLINGFLVVKTGIHSFVISLATMSIFFGGMLFLSRAQSYRNLPPVYGEIGRLRIFGCISLLLFIAAAVAVALSVTYRLTAVGREMLTAGAAPEAAELSGIRVEKTYIYCHMLSGGLAGVTALMLTARLGAAIPSMAGQLGQDWLLPAFLGPVLGGTLLSGGRVSVLGTVLGGFLVAMLTNGLLQLQVGEFWVQTCLGVLLLSAVLVDKLRSLYVSTKGSS